MVVDATAARPGAIRGMQEGLSALPARDALGAGSGLVATFAGRQRLVGKDAFDRLERKHAAGQ